MNSRVKSLNSLHHHLADAEHQIEILESKDGTPFRERLNGCGNFPLKPSNLEVLQVNVGKMCNQTCKHCHVDAGPDRREIMTRETMRHCIQAVSQYAIRAVDITGGAPELNPDFQWFVESLAKIGVQITVRCNLTIILANPKFNYLPSFYREHNVEVISSLPHFSKIRTDAQRGEGVFATSIKSLQLLNEQGYGMEETDLRLNLVYNPTGAFLPGSQTGLERDFKEKLWNEHGVVFNELFTITNMPISRFLDYLLASGNYDMYMEKLLASFNPQTIEGLMCRNTLSVGWDGHLFDCDFNQMLDLRIDAAHGNHIKDFNKDDLANREIIVGQHCYGCTAGAGSSCGGAVVN